MKCGYLYMMSNRKNGTIYTGVSVDLIKRVYEHKSKDREGFTKRYGIDRIVYYEIYDEIAEAIKREKRIKKYPRQWKINLIESMNPEWVDLYQELLGLPEQALQ